VGSGVTFLRSKIWTFQISSTAKMSKFEKLVRAGPLLLCKSWNNLLNNTRGDSLEYFIPNLRIWQFNSRIMNYLKESNGLRLFWTWHRFGFYIWWTSFFVFFKVTSWFLTGVKDFEKISKIRSVRKNYSSCVKLSD